MFEEAVVDFKPSAGSVPLVGATIVVDQSDYPGVIRAAKDLAQDFSRVTKGDRSPLVLVHSEADYSQIKTKTAILVGSIGSSPLIQRLVKDGRLDTKKISGKGESFCTNILTEGMGSCESIFVIAGSDKRGAIFGVYTVSEQIGVSP
jgi:hypothetical protein